MTSTPSYAIGIDFGGTSVKLARVLSDGTIAARAVFDTTPGVESWLDAVEAALVPLRQGAEGECAGLGVGVPGFVDFERGFIHDLTNVPGWTAVPLAEKMKARFGLPAVIENDVNAMAAGECAFGAGKGLKNAVFITLGTGVGGGILIDGKVFRGAYSMAGELGHVSIDKDGIASPMGFGGVEQYVGNAKIAAYALSRIDAGEDGAAILRQAGGKRGAVSPKAIALAAQEGDPLAKSVFDYVADCLATMIASVAYVLQPEAFIIGGGVSNAGDVLFAPLNANLKRRLSPHFFSRLKILRAALGNDAGVVGCAALASHLA
jgi:glucokinase